MASSGTHRSWQWLSPRYISGIYALALVFILFSILIPERWLTPQTFATIANQSAVGGLLALALIMPMAAGIFDVSVGYVLGFTGVVAAWLLGNTPLPIPVVIMVSLGAAICAGLFNAFTIVALGVESIVATLGTGSIIFAATIAISGGVPLTANVSGVFSSAVATTTIARLTIPVLVFIAVMLILAFVTEHTSTGRYIYALGFDVQVARLSGLKTNGLRVLVLVSGAVIAGLAGLGLTGYVGSASPDVGPAYLLPAFAGVFLGSTQIRPGRFNAFGTLVAVMFIGAGNYGILLLGGPVWTPQVFQGAALIAAVAIAALGRNENAIVRRLTIWSRARVEHRAEQGVDSEPTRASELAR